MSEAQQLIDNIVNNFKRDNIRIATQIVTGETPAETQTKWIADLEYRIAKAETERRKQWAWIAANITLATLCGYLSIVALIMVNQIP